MELCPVCQKEPLTGRQSTCSSACRSARYRGSKKQRGASQSIDTHADVNRDSRRTAMARRRPSVSKSIEQLVTRAVDRIIEAIQQRGIPSAQPSSALRLDMREQVTAQAPQQAAGYRLALPGRDAGERPKFVPACSRTRHVPWYSLEPFEYPDDLRLCDGSWYRVVWVDAQGQRVRLQPGESLPGLYFFVGPSQPSPSQTNESRSASDLSVSQKDSSPSSRIDAKPSVLTTFSPQLLEATTAEDRAALGSLTPLSIDDSSLLIRFVLQPEWMIQLLHHEKRVAAEAASLPPPSEPLTSLSHDERKTIYELISTRMSAPFILLVKLLHAYARKRDRAALDFLPTPLPPLPEAEQRRLQAALTNRQKRMYLDYVHTRQESLLRGILPLPDEPPTSLSTKERSQLRRMLRDTRAVILFEQEAHPPLMFFEP